jgi:hypothetical protein
MAQALTAEAARTAQTAQTAQTAEVAQALMGGSEDPMRRDSTARLSKQAEGSSLLAQQLYHLQCHSCCVAAT